MKKFKKIVVALIFMVMTINLTACSTKDIANLLEGNSDYVVFDEKEINKDEILSYTSKYEGASSNYLSKQLGEEALLMYKSLIYAYENQYKEIEYYSSNNDFENEVLKAVHTLKAENPFFDWNDKIDISYTAMSSKSTGKYYKLENSQADEIQFKEQAYNKAKELVASIDNSKSNYDKLLWIYDYIVNNISYVDDVNSYLEISPRYIYDALIEGKTQCSGFADTMTMMCNMVGIETMTVSGELEEGHAWNLVNLDGQFYNCDPTNESSVRQDLPENAKNIKLNFLKSDNVFTAGGYKIQEEVKVDFPKATSDKYDNAGVDLTMETISGENDIVTIGQAVVNCDNYVIVSSPEVKNISDSKAEEILNKVIDYVSANTVAYRQTHIYMSVYPYSPTGQIIFFITRQ